MDPISPTPPSERKPDRTRSVALVAVGALALAGLLVWVFLHGGVAGGESQVSGPFDGARLVSMERAGEMAKDAGHPVFWAGPLPGMKMAMNRDALMNVHVRYLPDGVDPETTSNTYFTVGSYPFEQAFEATARLAGEPGREEIQLPGAVGFFDRISGDRLVLSFRGHPDLQVEVFHPRLEEALEAVRRGDVVPIP